jgi:hypothetical protein
MDVRTAEEQIAAELAAVVKKITKTLDELALSSDRNRAARLVTTRDVLSAALTAFNSD